MAKEVRLPELGEGVERAEVVRVLVAPGDAVVVDQPLLEIETDKATVEVLSPAAGTVAAGAAEAGATIAVGQLILTLEAGGTAAEAPEPPEGPAPAPPATPAPPAVPLPTPLASAAAEPETAPPRRRRRCQHRRRPRRPRAHPLDRRWPPRPYANSRARSASTSTRCKGPAPVVGSASTT